VKPPPPEFDTIVALRILIAEDVLRIDLARTDGNDFPPWEPGSHIDLILPSGVERQYSLCGRQDDQRVWTIAVLREPAGRGGSSWLHHGLETGAELRVRGPSNHFALEPASGYRFIAAGIGITAILPMIRSLDDGGAPWALDYAAKSAQRTAFLRDVQELKGGQVTVHLASEGQRLDITSLQPAPGELVYACGPAGLLDALSNVSESWEAGALRMERFEAALPKAGARNAPFTVDLVSSGETLEVREQESILDVVEAAGIFVLSSCREGTCGTCETLVVSGKVDHRDSILSDAERCADDRLMICVSRAAESHLALDL
jgi:ferredoxin-NADP reductase